MILTTHVLECHSQQLQGKLRTIFQYSINYIILKFKYVGVRSNKHKLNTDFFPLLIPLIFNISIAILFICILKVSKFNYFENLNKNAYILV